MEKVIRLITFKLRNTDFMKVVFVSVCFFCFLLVFVFVFVYKRAQSSNYQ